jgi:hypothetical protein
LNKGKAMTKAARATLRAIIDGLRMPPRKELVDLVDPRGDRVARFDAIYGESLRELLPRRLADLLPRRRAA